MNMNIQPQGESIRKAVKFVSDERKYNPERDIMAVVGEACVKFDLSPKDAVFLTRFVKQEND